MGVKMEQSLMLSILTKGLPGAVTHPLYLEYNSRKREVDNVVRTKMPLTHYLKRK